MTVTVPQAVVGTSNPSSATMSSSGTGMPSLTTPTAGDVIILKFASLRSAGARTVSSVTGVASTWAKIADYGRIEIWKGTGTFSGTQITLTQSGSGESAVALEVVRGLTASTVISSETTVTGTSLTGADENAELGQYVTAMSTIQAGSATFPSAEVPSGWTTASQVVGSTGTTTSAYRIPSGASAVHRTDTTTPSSAAMTNVILVIGDAAGSSPATVTLAGTTQAATAAFAVATVLAASLAGTVQPSTGSFDLSASAQVSLAGVVQPLTAAFDLDAAADQVDVSLAGTMQPVVGSFAVLAGADLSLAGTVQSSVGSFDLSATATIALAGTTQAPTGEFDVSLADRTVSLAGAARRPTAAITLVSQPAIRLAGTTRPPTGAIALAALPTVTLAGTVQAPIAAFITYVVAPVVEVPIVAAEHAVVTAQAFGAVTLAHETQPVYTISQAHVPRATTRILVGNKDVTYWRGCLTPQPKYTLVEPLLYGPGTIDFPQVAACFGDEPGQGDLWFMHPGATVEVQRVLDGVVIGTDYKGVVTDYDIAGRDLTVNVGGELQGRAELVNRQPVIFPRVNDIGHQIADAVRDLGLPHFPALGTITGIETMTTGGTGHLEHLQGLFAKAWTRSGSQWTCMPDAGTGVYETHRKDTTTIHGTVFLDDARTVANLRRDISEEPNRIFVTCVTPAGQRVRFGVYPGLTQGPVPEFPGHMESGDTGDGVRLLLGKLHAMGYLRLYEVTGGYDFDVVEAVKALQDDAGLPKTGEVNEQTWNALYDLDITGQSLEWAEIMPAAQRSKVRKFNRSASGTIIEFNPDYEPDTLRRDRNIDLGPGVTRDQAREFARTVLHDSDDPNWTGTITFNTGALIRGEGAVGMTVTEADVMDARELKPGMNLNLPQFAGGTLVHVAACEVGADGIVTATVDTRARDALEVWEVIARNKESRNDPSRHRIRKARSSTISKDSIGEWDEIGGLLGQDVQLMAGWNSFEVVGAAEGTIAKLRYALADQLESACAVFGRPTDRGLMDDVVGDPFTDAGKRAWRREETRARLDEHWLLYSAGTEGEPCGYGADLKSDGGTLTGVHLDEGGFRYASETRTVLYVLAYVRAETTLEMGRIMWPQLEAGV